VLITTEIAGTIKITANIRLSLLRATKLQLKPIKIKMFTEASSRKSILSANSETEPNLVAK
jgi:hypothetical protein